jgi:hypothetical protein
MAAWAVAAAAPGASYACACGCGIFDVATSAMFPGHSGPVLFLEQDFMDQSENWSGRSPAPAADNQDKRIRTNFWTVGLQYMFNRSWTLETDLPYWQRQFVTTDESGATQRFEHSALGDARIKLTYTGFEADLSTGVTFGVQLPTGDSTYVGFDPDTEIGSGSTNLILGAYHLGRVTADNRWSWYTNALWNQPILHKEQFRPGADLDALFGVYYDGWRFGTSVHVAPLLQVVGAWHGHDAGSAGHPLDSGYTRLFLAPGVEIDAGRTRIYFDISHAIYTNVSGNQLVARNLFKLSVSMQF